MVYLKAILRGDFTAVKCMSIKSDKLLRLFTENLSEMQEKIPVTTTKVCSLVG
jgi:hypothetical protein